VFEVDLQVNEYQGNDRFIYVSMDEGVIVRIPDMMDLDPGDTIGIMIPPESAYLLDRESGETLKSRSSDVVGDPW